MSDEVQSGDIELDEDGIKAAETAYWAARKADAGRNRALKEAIAAYLKEALKT